MALPARFLALFLLLGFVAATQETCANGGSGESCVAAPRAEEEVEASEDLEAAELNVALLQTRMHAPTLQAERAAPAAVAPNSTVSADCAASAGCHALGLQGFCCPNPDGAFLSCCDQSAEDAAAQAPPPPAAAVSDSAGACQKHANCAKLDLQGECCPNANGDYLGCCENAPTTTPKPPPAGGEHPNMTFAACELYVGCASLGLQGNCCPNDNGNELGCCKATAAITPELKPPTVPGPLMTFYMYRVRNDEEYELNGANMANLEGDLWYLHNEVVQHCPRKFNISTLQRYKVTMRSTAELNAQGKAFDNFVAFDQAKCTVPRCQQLHWDLYGYVVGCQPNFKGQVHMPGQPSWYSLPGTCPSKFYFEKTDECIKSEPGGLCKTPEVTGARDCTYYIEKAGTISLDDLTGFKDYNNQCQTTGNREYDEISDKGTGTSFWNGKQDEASGAARLAKIRALFAAKYPDMPTQLAEYSCPDQ